MKRYVSMAAVAMAVSLCLCAQSKQKIFHLAIGDAERRTRDARVVLDGITDTATGEVISADQLASRLRDTRLLLLGESHTTMDFHRVQLRVIRVLQESGRKVMIGLEMYPYTEQKSLDHWRDGLLTEDGLRHAGALVRVLGLPLELLSRHLPLRARSPAFRCTA